MRVKEVPFMPVKIEASPPGEPATSDEFFEAIALGDPKAAAEALRRMDSLGPMDLQLLADLLGGDPVHARLFPFILTLKRRRGRPSKDLLKKRIDQARVARAVAFAYKESGSVKLAVATIKDRAKKAEKKDDKTWGRSKIFEARKAIKNIEGRRSRPMTQEEKESALASDLGEIQIAEFVRDEGQTISESALPAAASADDEIDHAVKSTSLGPDGASGAGGTGVNPADQHGVALRDDERDEHPVDQLAKTKPPEGR
jgi:hypothetical protein